MSRFYGTVQGNRGKATRRGANHMRTSAQSYSGSVVTYMYDHNGVDWVSIRLEEGSSSTARFPLYEGPVKDLFDKPARRAFVEAFAREALAEQAGATDEYE